MHSQIEKVTFYLSSLHALLTVVTTSKPASCCCSISTPESSSFKISATSSWGLALGVSAKISASRKKLVTFENPPIVAVYGSWMNFCKYIIIICNDTHPMLIHSNSSTMPQTIAMPINQESKMYLCKISSGCKFHTIKNTQKINLSTKCLILPFSNGKIMLSNWTTIQHPREWATLNSSTVILTQLCLELYFTSVL